MELAGGSLIFLAFVVFYTLVIIYSLYTRTGSGINQRPWGADSATHGINRLDARTCRRRPGRHHARPSREARLHG